MKILGREITLVSVRDISREIDRNELEAWQKLMRVLRHEILNSVTPIRLLAGSISATLSTEMSEQEVSDCTAGKLLQRIALQYKEQFESMGVRLTVKFNEGGDPFQLDPRLIEQVLMNLVKNALEALSETQNPTLTLSSRQEKGKTILVVSDNGPGIPADQLDHIFIPFYTTREGGSGVGLSFAQHIMRLHGGRIHVSSRPGEGSEFQLIFGKS